DRAAPPGRECRGADVPEAGSAGHAAGAAAGAGGVVGGGVAETEMQSPALRAGLDRSCCFGSLYRRLAQLGPPPPSITGPNSFQVSPSNFMSWSCLIGDQSVSEVVILMPGR